MTHIPERLASQRALVKIAIAAIHDVLWLNDEEQCRSVSKLKIVKFEIKKGWNV